ncbi:MAG: threonylcarbamoyl-AMP synthase [Desulfosarcina sp.]|nr:threonylcarbamoyl-AMP synthase [Desulfobacterales bacterium]
MTKKRKNLKIINPDTPEPELILEAAKIIKQGGVIVFPTRGLYGIGADALNLKAVQRVFEIKQRPLNKPLSVLIKDLKELNNVAANISATAKLLIDQFWPGKLTIIFQAKKGLPESLTAGSGKIGVRLPAHKVACAIVSSIKVPLTGTSANISGIAGCSSIEALDPLILNQVDMVLDAGCLQGGTGSSVIDVTLKSPVILREGEIPEEQIIHVLNQNYGNFVDKR